MSLSIFQLGKWPGLLHSISIVSYEAYVVKKMFSHACPLETTE